MKRASKRMTSMVIALLFLLNMMVPIPAIADVGDGAGVTLGKVLRFEKENPIETITYKTGDTVDTGDFPTNVKAVREIEASAASEINFTQVKPSSSGEYVSPQNADELYEQGEPVIYKFGTGQYRMYGSETTLGTGWFSCDAQGNIVGMVQDVEVSFDTSTVSTDTAKSTTLRGTLLNGVSMSEGLSAPSVKVVVKAKSGDLTMDRVGIEWVSASDKYDISDDKTYLEITPKSNTSQFATYKVFMTKGGTTAIPKGAVEIRLPAHIFYGRDGKALDTLDIPLSMAPSEDGSTGFNYYIDEEYDEIVLKNYKELPAAYDFNMTIKYETTNAMKIEDGYNNEINATFEVNMGDQGYAYIEKGPIEMTVNTDVKAPTASKSVVQKYEKWNTSWGEEIENSDDYFFVQWQIDVTHSSFTQPADLLIQEKEQSTDFTRGGTLVGWFENDNIERKSCQELNETIFDSFTAEQTFTASRKKSLNVVMAYPRTMLEDSDVITNHCDVVSRGIDGKVKSTSVETEYKYIEVDYEYNGDIFSFDKKHVDSSSDNKTLKYSKYILKEGSPYYLQNYSEMQLYAQNRGWGLTANGTKQYTTVIEDDLMYIENEPVKDGDILLKDFMLEDTFKEYNFVVDVDKGYTAVEDTAYDTYSPLKVFVKKGKSEGWQLAGSIKKTSKSQYIWSPTDGDSKTVSGTERIKLPDGFSYIKFEHSTKKYQDSFNPRVSFEIQPSEHIKKIIEDTEASVTLTNICSAYLRNSEEDIISAAPISYKGNGDIKNDVESSDLRQYGTSVAHDSISWTMSDLSGTTGFSKNKKSTSSDKKESREKITYSVLLDEYISIMGTPYSKSQWSDLNLFPQHREGIFYDLLPIGTYLDEASILVYDRAKRKCDFSYELHQNWRNSGRTMFIVHAKEKDGIENWSNSKSYLETGYYLEYSIWKPWSSIFDYGSDTVNDIVYTSDYELFGGKTESDYKSDEYFSDLDEDGNFDSTKENYSRKKSVTISLSPTMAYELGFYKKVNSPHNLNYSSSAKTTVGDTYNYQLRFANAENAYANNVVFFDVLESSYNDNPYWKGVLENIELNQLEEKGIEPVVYYSTYGGFTNLTLNPTETDLTSSIWSKVKPSNNADITAIAIDCSKKTSGEAYQFSPKESAVVVLNMRAPADGEGKLDDVTTSEIDESVYAYNSAYLRSDTTSLVGDDATSSTKETEPTKVSLQDVDTEIHKKSTPDSGTLLSPKVVMAGDTVTYEVTGVNNEISLTLKDYIIEDVIPDNMTVKTDEIKYYYGTDSSTANLVSSNDAIAIQKDGQKLTFVVSSLSAKKQITFIIPAKIKENIGAETFVNKAKITSFNGVNYDIPSEITYHRTRVETKDFDVQKNWSDNNDKYGLRPESIAVQLYADGKKVDGVTAILKKTDNWKYIFKNLKKYVSTDKDTEVNYSVKEVSKVSGYTSSYSTDGKTVTNTINTQDAISPNVLKIKKYQTGTTDPVKDAVFEVKDGDKVLGTGTTDENGEATINFSVEGYDAVYNYTLEEKSAPTGYIKDTTVWTVKLTKQESPSIEFSSDLNKYILSWKWNLELLNNGSSETKFSDGILTAYNTLVPPIIYQDKIAPNQIKIKKFRTGTNEPVKGAIFEIKDNDTVIATGETNKAGELVLDFSVSGLNSEYNYTLAEKSAPEGYIKDDTQWTLKLTKQTEPALNPDSGTVERVWAWDLSLTKNGAAEDKYNDGVLTVYNEYHVAPRNVLISGTKYLLGRKIKDKEFTFQIKEGGKLIGTAKNDANGNIEFEPITYNQKDTGTHTYNVSEVRGNKEGVTYDGSVLTVIVKVKDNGDGTLNVEKTYPKNGLKFVNIFSHNSSTPGHNNSDETEYYYFDDDGVPHIGVDYHNKPNVNNVPKTADNSCMSIYICIMLMSLLSTVILVFFRKKEKANYKN